MPTGEIKALTSLRGIAAMMVVLTHFSATAEQHSASPIPSLVPHGYLAVDLFFVLSGFIMAYTYLADFQARGIRAFADFLLKRAARIIPLNTSAVMLVLFAGLVSQWVLSRNVVYASNNPIMDGMCNLLMLQGLGLGVNLNAPSWSISTEFAAYLIFPVLLPLMFARRVVIPYVAVGVCLATLGGVAASHSRLGLATSSIEGGLARCFTEFTIGLATYRTVSHPGVRARLAPDGVAAAAIVCTLALLFLRVDMLVALFVPLLIGSLACNRGRVAQVFAARVPYFLGVISFSIYLLHAPFRPFYLEVLRAIHPAPLPAPLAMAAALVGSLLVLPFAWAGYAIVERPGRHAVRNLSSRVFRGRPTISVPAASPKRLPVQPITVASLTEAGRSGPFR